ADALDKYGLGYDALAAAHPGLVYCSISGYGKTGPDRYRAGYDQAIQAEIGVISVNGEPGSEPTRLPVSYQDVITGLYAANSVQAALRSRDRTGRGQWIDLSLIDCGLSAFLNYAGDTLGGVETRRWGNAALASPVNAYRTRDDGRIMMIVGSDFQFRRFLEAAGRTELMDDARFATIKARMENQELVERTVADIFLADDRDAWMEKLRANSVAAGPVRSVKEGMASPEVRARGMIHEIDHPVMGRVEVVGSPIRLSETPVPPPAPAPILGADTETVLADILDMDPAAIATAREAGALG
ncbi:MAG: CaiB/BaiF CoA transferase family protein, partial [Alphaproteobacteria bacterium]